MKALKVISAIKWTAIAAIVAVIGVLVWKFTSFPDDDSNVRMQKAKVTDISPMLRLCAVEFIEDIPVKASKGPRHLFARETVRGSISFDLEKLRMEERGDTLVVALPPEIVEIYESTEPGSYEVIDTWNDRFLGSTNFTTAEENEIKRKVEHNFRNTICRQGYVKQAREEAMRNLGPLIEAATQRPVVVIDTIGK